VVVGAASNAHGYRCPQTPSPAKTATYQGFLGRVFQLDGQELPYRLFVPANYDASKSYPLVLYLHHAGLAGTDANNESGWDNCVQLTSEIGSGDDYGGVFTHRAVDTNGTRFDTQQKYPHFVVAPHANSPQYGFGGGTAGSATRPEHATRKLVWGILDQVRKEFSIDGARLYVTGISMGCYGTWDIIMRTPGVFAAASPQSCQGDPNTSLLAKLKDVPIWSMCGTNDSYFNGAQAMADGMKQIGATAFTFTAMQGVGHSINDRGYDYPGFIDWMFAQRLATGGSAGAAGAGGIGGAGAGGRGGMSGAAGAAGPGGQPGQGGTGGTVAATGTAGGAGTHAGGGDGGTIATGGTGAGGAPPTTGAGGTASGAAGTSVVTGAGGAPATGAGGTAVVAGTGGAAGAAPVPERDAGTPPHVGGEALGGCMCQVDGGGAARDVWALWILMFAGARLLVAACSGASQGALSPTSTARAARGGYGEPNGVRRATLTAASST
jgi:hypothetical protein